jgi:aminomethyltransferase
VSDTYDPADDEAPAGPEKLPLDSWHRARGARMVPFAGYEMPVQYDGIIAEHLWTRSHAGVFDVSHMGQLTVAGERAAEALEAVLPVDLATLKPGSVRYSLLLDENGGILDDLMVTNISQEGSPQYYLVVNGATKWDDIGHLREHLPDDVTLNHLADSALLALQGPQAAAALDSIFPGVADGLRFMQGTGFEWEGVMVGVGRSGYTGEDGFEITLPASHVERVAEELCGHSEVKPVGLGARDSLRLEAGLPLYGHDLTPQTDPAEAGLAFAINKRRREEGGFPGAERILAALAAGPARKRVGLALDGRMAAREGAAIIHDGHEVGRITSGGFSPSLERPIAMGYVEAALTAPGTPLEIDVRGRRIAATVVPIPFVPHRYFR